MQPNEFPLTPLQTLFWAGHRVHGDVPVYNMAHTFVLRQTIDAVQFQAAFQYVVDVTDALRTVFRERDGEPIQCVLERFPFGIAVVDFSGEFEPEAAAENWVRDRVCRVLDIERCCFDSALLRVADDRHIWFLNQHHLICDATSTAIVVDRVARAYAAGADRTKCAVGSRFSDYVQRQVAEVASIQRQRVHYWQTRLSMDVATPSFYGRAGQAMPARVKRIAHALGTQRSARVRELVHSPEFCFRSERVSLFNVFAAMLSVYLMRITGERRFIIGMPHHGRVTDLDWNTAGAFIDVLPLPVRIEPGYTFAELTASVAKEAADSVRHRPFAGIGAVGSRTFDVLFNYQVAQFCTFNGQPAEQEWINPGFGTERFVLQVHDFAATGDLSLYFDLDVDVFDENARDRVVRHFLHLLDLVLSNPDSHVAALHVLSEDEQRAILASFNPANRSLPEPDTVTGQFHAQCRRTPDGCAVRFDDTTLTYAQLDEVSNQLAHELQRRGVGAGVPVGFCLERSAQLVITMLGILKAGGVYVPLDPFCPPERLALMADDAAVAVLVTQEPFVGRFEGLACDILRIDQGADFPDIPPSAVDPRAKGVDLAYLMYTSGSTGMPKAVAVPHRAIVRLVVDTNYLDIRPNDRIGQASNAAFDAATFEIWGALLNGAQVVGIPKDVALNPSALADLIAQGDITILFLTTALFNQIAQIKPDAFRPLRYLLFGGEACDPAAIRRVLQFGAPEHLIHVYGPTENTTFTTFHEVRVVADNARTVPIGKPIDYSYVHVLADDRCPVPIGVPGELYIGGFGLAAGYYNREVLTEAAFVPSPFAKGERLYRSGDRARYLDDGSIEFVERIDSQIKLRGYRIEPGEIETALKSHPGIQDAVVLLREDSPGHRRLVGYLVCETSAQPETESLRACLQRSLPDYMIPAAFVCIPRIPLTANGKVDRSAFPAPDTEASVAEYVEPRTPLESELARLWADVLQVPHVGATCHFFEIGGHSLLAVRIMAAVRERYGYDIPLTRFFQNPTVAGMAALIGAGADGQVGGAPGSTPFTLVPIQPKGNVPPLFCVATAGGVLFPYFNLAPLLGPEQPIYGLQDPALEGTRLPFDSVEALAAHYVEVMRDTQPKGPYYLCGWSFGGTVAYEMGRQLRAAGEKVALLVIIDAMQAPPDLTVQGGVMKFVRVWLRRARIFVLNTYHLKPYILDGLYLVFRRTRSSSGAVSIREYFRWAFTDVVFKHAGIADVVSKDNLLMMKIPAFRRIFKVLHANGEAWKKYVAAKYDGRLTVFRAEVQPPELVGNETLGWGEVAGGGVDVYVIPGYHSEILGKGIHHCAAQLEECIERARTHTIF